MGNNYTAWPCTYDTIDRQRSSCDTCSGNVFAWSNVVVYYDCPYAGRTVLRYSVPVAELDIYLAMPFSPQCIDTRVRSDLMDYIGSYCKSLYIVCTGSEVLCHPGQSMTVKQYYVYTCILFGFSRLFAF